MKAECMGSKMCKIAEAMKSCFLFLRAYNRPEEKMYRSVHRYIKHKGKM
jgi:hypothetical protein